MFWRYVAHLGLKWRKSKFWRVGSVLDFLISGLDSDSGSWSRSVGLNMTCVQNLGSIGRGSVGFGIGLSNLEVSSSLSLNRRVNCVFRVVWRDLRARLSLYGILGLIGIFS